MGRVSSLHPGIGSNTARPLGMGLCKGSVLLEPGPERRRRQQQQQQQREPEPGLEPEPDSDSDSDPDSESEPESEPQPQPREEDAQPPPQHQPCVVNGDPGESADGSLQEETLYDTIKPPAAAAGPCSDQRASPPGRMDEPAPNALVVRIGIPDLQQTKCLRLNPDVPVWASKQRILCTLNHSLKDVLNYGLFQPAFNGRAGKFLDEERLLREYPLNPETPVPYLEFRYKRRVYTQSLLDDKQFAKLHTKANLKKFMEYVQNLNVEKISRLLEKGLDPNFHDPDTGECPLTLAVQLECCVEVIKALKNGGAHLDFRTREGMTALHKAVRCRNHTAMMTLLDLGASTDYKDSRGLTPLYHSAMVGGDPYCCELLLHDYARVGCLDENGWQEIHQACRYGHVQHLEHLLFYGADMTAQNASGNSALHVCALYNQESCARVLLFRGASKEIRNYNSQTAFQVAIIAGNFELAEIIKTHKESDVVPFRETPSYTKRRRIIGVGGLSSPRLLQRSASDNNLKSESRPSYSPVPSLRGLPPQLLAQMQGVAAGAGLGDSGPVSTGSSRSTHSRSPSLQRVQEEKEADAHTFRRSSRGKARKGLPVLLQWGGGLQRGPRVTTNSKHACAVRTASPVLGMATRRGSSGRVSVAGAGGWEAPAHVLQESFINRAIKCGLATLGVRLFAISSHRLQPHTNARAWCAHTAEQAFPHRIVVTGPASIGPSWGLPWGPLYGTDLAAMFQMHDEWVAGVGWSRAACASEGPDCAMRVLRTAVPPAALASRVADVGIGPVAATGAGRGAAPPEPAGALRASRGEQGPGRVT
ncbi:SH3 and multiple ankyrin repeat domains protein 3-like [Varanus komodoensis]|uniref:SH3 and multiple ankyrin repeat domains protein 3-like n=1 Tax=Varanus komodoensis TaxID=61221 RepID=UPI001CF7CABD|nr:SH3 and multiple ankyrin repeat domains protein 3-like [Varanus komodoensis]